MGNSINQKVRELYNTKKYFVPIKKNVDLSYENDYHEITYDPDGKKRYLLEERKEWLAGIKEITDFLDKAKPGKLIDIGCGLGWLLSYLNKEWDLYGLEVSKFAADKASKYAPIHFGPIETLDNSNFDYVVLNHVIEHLEDPIKALKKIKQILKPNGFFICATPDFDSAMARRYGEDYRMLHDSTHISLFSNDSLHRCLRDLGFKIFEVEYPYFDTPWFNKNDLEKIFDKDQNKSPAFYGNYMTFFCRN